MIEFGKTLKSAREAKGLSVAQVAEATRLLPRIVEDLEKEDFSHLPAPIYGRGFVKLYCEEVGLDPKPMIAEFMDILNGGRGGDAKERPAAVPPPAPAPAAAPEPITAPEPPLRPAVKPAPIDETTAAALGESAKPEPAATAPVPDEKAKLANAGRTPMDIPPLYVD